MVQGVDHETAATSEGNNADDAAAPTIVTKQNGSRKHTLEWTEDMQQIADAAYGDQKQDGSRQHTFAWTEEMQQTADDAYGDPHEDLWDMWDQEQQKKKKKVEVVTEEGTTEIIWSGCPKGVGSHHVRRHYQELGDPSTVITNIHFARNKVTKQLTGMSRFSCGDVRACVRACVRARVCRVTEPSGCFRPVPVCRVYRVLVCVCDAEYVDTCICMPASSTICEQQNQNLTAESKSSPAFPCSYFIDVDVACEG